MKKNIEVYKFVKENDKYILTHKGMINPYGIERILGKVKVKGKTGTYEMIEIKNRLHPNENGIYLMKRSAFTFEIIEHFITFYSNGDRSKQHYPYEKDLLDDELLDDLDIIVLTYKWFYSGDDFLADKFLCVKKENVTDDLIKKLDEDSKKEIERMNYLHEVWNKRKQEQEKKVKWEKI